MLDRQTLETVDAWLKDLETAAERLPTRHYDPNEAPTQTALRVGRYRGISEARAYIADQVKKLKGKE